MLEFEILEQRSQPPKPKTQTPKEFLERRDPEGLELERAPPLAEPPLAKKRRRRGPGDPPVRKATTYPKVFRCCRFVFPSTVELGMTFRSREAIANFMKDEAFRGCNVAYGSMFRYSCRPSPQSCLWMHLTCKKCPARISLRRTPGGEFRVTGRTNQHEHRFDRGRDKPQDGVLQFIRQRLGQCGGNNLNRLRDEVIDNFQITSQEFHRIKKRFKAEELDSYACLESFFLKNGFRISVEWPDDPMEKFPETIVAASPTMRETYREYGDLLAFTMVDGLLSQRNRLSQKYKLGVFVCYDSSNQPLVVGLAMTCRRCA